MDSIQKRYIFVDFEDLKVNDFKKLDKICDKVFIVISSKEESVPFSIIPEIQKMPGKVRWIQAEAAEKKERNFILAFTIGKIHQKVRRDIEFVVLSEDPHFDALLSAANMYGRQFRRATLKNSENATPAQNSPGEDSKKRKSNIGTGREVTIDEKKDLVEKTMAKIIHKLIRSGNRPSNISLLKDYIRLNNGEMNFNGKVDSVINMLIETKEISIQDEEITYNF